MPADYVKYTTVAIATIATVLADLPVAQTIIVTTNCYPSTFGKGATVNMYASATAFRQKFSSTRLDVLQNGLLESRRSVYFYASPDNLLEIWRVEAKLAGTGAGSGVLIGDNPIEAAAKIKSACCELSGRSTTLCSGGYTLFRDPVAVTRLRVDYTPYNIPYTGISLLNSAPGAQENFPIVIKGDNDLLVNSGIVSYASNADCKLTNPASLVVNLSREQIEKRQLDRTCRTGVIKEKLLGPRWIPS